MVKPYGGFYISHERSEGADSMWKVKSDPTPFVSLLEAVNETITIGRETGVPVVASHLKAKGASYWGSSQAATRLIREAREGLEVYADQYPYETSGTDCNTVLIPGWAIAAAGQATGDQLEAGGGGRGRADGVAAAQPSRNGSRSGWATMRTSANPHGHLPRVRPSGLGEGLPHARFYGTMARKIRRFVLDRAVISIPFAIRSMTSLPAQIMGLKEKGLLRPGY